VNASVTPRIVTPAIVKPAIVDPRIALYGGARVSAGTSFPEPRGLNITSYAPGQTAIDGGRETNAGTPLRQEADGADALLKPWIAEAEALFLRTGSLDGLRPPPVLRMAGNMSVYGWGANIRLNGSGVEQLLSLCCSKDMNPEARKALFSLVKRTGLQATVIDTGGAFTNVKANRLDLCVTKALNTKSFSMSVFVEYNPERVGKPQSDPLGVLARAFERGQAFWLKAVGGAKPESTNVVPREVESKVKPKVVPLALSTNPRYIPAEGDPMVNRIEAQFLAVKGQPLNEVQQRALQHPVYLEGSGQLPGTVLVARIEDLPPYIQAQLEARLKMPISEIKKTVPALVAQAVPTVKADYSGKGNRVEIYNGRGNSGSSDGRIDKTADIPFEVVLSGKSLPKNASGQSIEQLLTGILSRAQAADPRLNWQPETSSATPTNKDYLTYSEWNSALQTQTGQNKIYRASTHNNKFWIDQYGTVYFRQKPIPKLNDDEVVAFQNSLTNKELLWMTREFSPGYFESPEVVRRSFYARLTSLQIEESRDHKSINDANYLPPASAVLHTNQKRNSIESALANKYGFPIVPLDSIQWADRGVYDYYLASKFVYHGTRHALGDENLSATDYLALKELETFQKSSRYDENNPRALQEFLIAKRDELKSEYQIFHAELNRKRDKGAQVTKVEEAKEKSLANRYRFFKLVDQYYSKLEAKGTPLQLSAGRAAISNLVEAYLSSEPYKPVEIPVYQDGREIGRETITLNYLLGQILRRDDGAMILKDLTDGGIKDLYLALNGGEWNDKGIQSGKLSDLIDSKPFFRSSEQIVAGKKIPDRSFSRLYPNARINRPPLDYLRAEYLQARTQDSTRQQLAAYFLANPKAWLAAQSDQALMSYLDRLMFRRDVTTGLPARDQECLVSVQYIDAARAKKIKESKETPYGREHSEDADAIRRLSNIEFYDKYLKRELEFPGFVRT
jgi:hypothetical protein